MKAWKNRLGILLARFLTSFNLLKFLDSTEAVLAEDDLIIWDYTAANSKQEMFMFYSGGWSHSWSKTANECGRDFYQ